MAMDKNSSFIITGVFITMFSDGDPINCVTNLNVSVRRDIQPVYAMFGNPNPIAFAYNVRRIGGMIEFAALDGYGAMAIIPDDYVNWLSLTEGLQVSFAKSTNTGYGEDGTKGVNAGDQIASDNDFNTAIDGAKQYTQKDGVVTQNNAQYSLGASNPYNSIRSSTTMRAAMRNFLAGSTSNLTNQPAGGLSGRVPGVATWSQQKPIYLDQVNNLMLQFTAMIENKGDMYTRAMIGVTFHTHNIAIGMQVGSVEEGHYYCYHISPWAKQQDLISKDGKRTYQLPTPDFPIPNNPDNSAYSGNATPVPRTAIQP